MRFPGALNVPVIYYEYIQDVDWTDLERVLEVARVLRSHVIQRPDQPNYNVCGTEMARKAVYDGAEWVWENLDA